MSKNSTTIPKESGLVKFMSGVERIGNKLPHPFFLFCALAVIVVILSAIFAGTSVTYTAPTADKTSVEEVTVAVVNLLSKGYWQNVFQNLVKIYINFAPLGTVMVMMFAIGFAQDSGFFHAFMKKSLLGAPQIVITYAFAVICVCSNMAANAGIIFSATVGAALFASIGRNPIIGCATGYAAAHGGFTANLMLSADDVLQSSITQSAASGMNINAPINPMYNYFFMFVTTFVIAGVVTFVTEKILPKTCKYGAVSGELNQTLTPEEKRGLRFSGIAFIGFIIVMLLLTVPSNAFFRAADGTLIPSSPLVNSVVTILFLFFILLGTAYGIGAGTIKKQADFPNLMGKGLSDSISFFVIAFPSALFIQFFNDSKLANVVSVNGAEMLKSLNFTGIPLVVCFILLTTFLNLFMTSGSSKWLILAPIFVPMFSVLGYSPAFTNLCYRIGDTMTNPIAPINVFMPIVIAVMNQYKRKEDPELGIGSLMSMTLPFSIGYMLTLIPMVIIWMLLNLPLGPGATIMM